VGVVYKPYVTLPYHSVKTFYRLALWPWYISPQRKNIWTLFLKMHIVTLWCIQISVTKILSAKVWSEGRALILFGSLMVYWESVRSGPGYPPVPVPIGNGVNRMSMSVWPLRMCTLRKVLDTSSWGSGFGIVSAMAGPRALCLGLIRTVEYQLPSFSVLAGEYWHQCFFQTFSSQPGEIPPPPEFFVGVNFFTSCRYSCFSSL